MVEQSPRNEAVYRDPVPITGCRPMGLAALATRPPGAAESTGGHYCRSRKPDPVDDTLSVQDGTMHETQDDLATLQDLLDRSIARAGEHLRGIITPGKRTLSAGQVAQALDAMAVLVVATTTAAGEPRTSAVDGHFLRGHWVFTTSGTAAKAHHLRVRPAVSVTHVDGERLGVFTHGTAEFLTPDSPDFAQVETHLTAHYGASPSSWGPEIVYVRVQPTWMVAYAFDPKRFPET
jgi:general stress protein 26